GRLHVITDRVEVAAAALAGGAPVVQVRAKSATDAEAYELTCRVLDLAQPDGATVLVNDRVDVALAAGAAGVHVGAHDLPVGTVRRLVSDRSFLVGGTAREPVSAKEQEAAGASY